MKSKRKQPIKTENPVQPTTRDAFGKPHVMEQMFESDTMPTLKSVGFAKLEGTNTYVAFTLTTKGKDVLLIEVEEPNLRQIAEESAKLNFMTQIAEAGI